MLNKQPIEKSVSDPTHLDVVDVFKTIQGEGPNAGKVACFIRLAGCNINCPLCDTNYTKGRRTVEVNKLYDMVSSLIEPGQLVVITGGEPFRQNLYDLFYTLSQTFKLQIETNGTVFPSWFEMYTRELGELDITISPKTMQIHPAWSSYDMFNLSWKYVISAGAVSEKDGLPTNVLGREYEVARPLNKKRAVQLGLIFVQPADEKNAEKDQANTQAAIDSCMKFGYRLCLQIQKIVNLP